MPPKSRPVRIDITAGTVVKVLCAVLAVWLWFRLWQWVLLVLVAVFLAVGLDPVVGWLERHRIRRAVGALLVMATLAALLAAFAYFAGSELVEQGRLLGGRLSEVRKQISERIPPALLQMVPSGQGSGGQLGGYAARLGAALASGVVSIGVAFILTIYFLLDGRRTFEWLTAFAPRDQRPRVRRTAAEAQKAVTAYVRGNGATSALAAISAYVFLLLLDVPAALLLALLTGIFDFIPVLGVFLTAIPMVLVALTVSPWVALATAIFNAGYNMLETYYISPKVYGNEMRLSSLAVILAFAVGAELGGVVGALVALPIAAMYPAVESIWLADRLGAGVAEDHRHIEGGEEH